MDEVLQLVRQLYIHMEHGQADQFLSKKITNKLVTQIQVQILIIYVSVALPTPRYFMKAQLCPIPDFISKLGPSGALSSELASLGGGAHPQLSLPLPLRDQTALLPLHCVWVQQVDDYDINVDPFNIDECDDNS